MKHHSFLKRIFPAVLIPIALAIQSSAMTAGGPAFGNAETMGMVGKMIGDQITLRCERFELKFAADGKPVSFLLLPEGKELLNVKDPGDGFVVLNRAGETTPLSRLSLAENGKLLVARTAWDGQEVAFRVNIAKSHIAFQVERLIRFSPVPDLTLAFRMNVDPSVEAVPHNYMVEPVRQGGQLEVKWSNLWTVYKGDAPGGFSLIQFRDGEDKDESLLHVWTEEPIAHPKVQGAWTYERATEWMAKWRERFIPQKGTIILEDTTMDGLREGLKYAVAAGVSEINLMPWIWRGEYWPVQKTTAGINTEIFPKGEEDLKAFAQEVNAKGMWLSLHWVSAGIGFWDPKYVGQKPDRRLASWGGGKLDGAVDASASELKFKPDAGVYAPYIGPGSSSNFAPGLARFDNYNIIRVEDELVRFDEMKDTDKPVWTITGCKRGFGSTKAASHPAGADSAGLIVPYNQNLIPDNWSTLLNEMAETYASFINRVGVSVVSFDGMELHRYYGGTGEKLAELIYSALDHPTLSSTSHIAPARAWFEFRFLGVTKSAKALAIVRPRTTSMNSSSMLMADYELGQTAVLKKSLAMGLAAGDRGFNVESFRKHGLHEQILERVKMWRAISAALSDEQRNMFDMGHVRPADKSLSQAGNHNEMPYVYVPEDKGNSWNIYPVAVLNTGNQDSLWYHGQENGPVEPWRFVKPNEEHVWTNPFPAQPLRFVMHVLAATRYENPDNYDIQPKSAMISQVGDTRFSDENDGLKLSFQNRSDNEIWNERKLPVAGISPKKDWSDHRPVGMFVEGDGKNEVIVLQVRGEGGLGRDYAVPVDFTGKTYVEIPHGEASYALSKWGWRFTASKDCNYENLGKFWFGFGYLPAGIEASAKVSGMKALKEIPMPLVDPVIATAQGSLSVKGQVPSDHYLEYQGGETATVYDANWNKVGALPVKAASFSVPNGKSPITVKSSQTGALPWIEVQFLTRGEPIAVKK